MLVVTGRIEVEAGAMASLREAASVMVAATLAEDGCDKYQFAVDIERPGVIHLFEQWASAEALDEHFATPHFAAFSEVLLNAATGPAEFNRYGIASLDPLFG
jgi:quinol monooxygenase YgiN